MSLKHYIHIILKYQIKYFLNIINFKENTFIKGISIIVTFLLIIVYRNICLYAIKDLQYLILLFMMEVGVISFAFYGYKRFLDKSQDYLKNITGENIFRKLKIYLLVFLLIAIKVILTIFTIDLQIKSINFIYTSSLIIIFISTKIIFKSEPKDIKEGKEHKLTLNGTKYFKPNHQILSIIIRDILFILRTKKNNLMLFFFRLLFSTSIFLLFIINNHFINYLSFIYIFVSLIFISFAFGFDDERNIKLNEHNSSFNKQIFIAEFFLWTFLNIMLYIFFSLAFLLFSFRFNFIIIFYTLCLSQTVLLYSIFIKRAFSNSEYEKYIVAIFSFIPLLIPFIIYQGVKRLNDKI